MALVVLMFYMLFTIYYKSYALNVTADHFENQAALFRHFSSFLTVPDFYWFTFIHVCYEKTDSVSHDEHQACLSFTQLRFIVLL